MARDKSKDSYTFDLYRLEQKQKVLEQKQVQKQRLLKPKQEQKQKTFYGPSLSSIDLAKAADVCIRKAIGVDGWEGEQGTTVGDDEPDDWPEYSPDDWPDDWIEIMRDESNPRYKIFWRCFWRHIHFLRRDRRDTPLPSLPLPLWRGGNDDDDDDDGKKYSWILLLTDDLVDMGFNWKLLKLLLDKLIRRHQDDLVYIRIEGTMTSMIKLKLITPGYKWKFPTKRWNKPTAGLVNFTEGVNTRDPRIVFELRIHPGLDENGNTVYPKRKEVYLHGLPYEEE